jgi:hypothetical protein
MYDMMLLSKHLFEYVPRIIEKDKIKKVSMNEDKSVFITYIDDPMEMLDNALQIEDLKLLL